MSLTWLRSQKEIVLTNYTQLTHDGDMKTLVESDASNLYMNLGTFTSQGIAEMPMSGGDPVRLPMPPPRKVLLDVSPDGKELLVVEYPGPAVDLPGSLWRVPLQGGPAKQVGNLEVTDASWSMDGKKLVYSTMGDLYLAGSEGEDPHKLAAFSGLIRGRRFRPMGRGFDSRGGTLSTTIVPCGKFPPTARVYISYFRSGRAPRSIPMGSGRRMGSIICSIRTDRFGRCQSAGAF